MNAFICYYSWLGSVIIVLAPLITMVAAILITLHRSKRRWVVRLLTFMAMFVALAIYFWVGGIPDPTRFNEPAEGFVMAPYGGVLILALFVYAPYAWFTRRRERPASIP